MDGLASVFNYDYQIVKLSEAEFAFSASRCQLSRATNNEKFWLMCSWELRRYELPDSTVNSHPVKTS